MEQKCIVCGADATTYFAGNPSIPLCSNPVCEQIIVDDINSEMDDLAGKEGS